MVREGFMFEEKKKNVSEKVIKNVLTKNKIGRIDSLEKLSNLE